MRRERPFGCKSSRWESSDCFFGAQLEEVVTNDSTAEDCDLYNDSGLVLIGALKMDSLLHEAIMAYGVPEAAMGVHGRSYCMSLGHPSFHASRHMTPRSAMHHLT